MLEVVDVRTADTGLGDGDKHLVPLDLGNRALELV